MATPHRGSELANWSTIVSNLLNLMTFGKVVRKTLLHVLKTNLKALMEISKQFVQRSATLKIMSFVEQQVEPGLKSLVSFLSYHPQK